MVIMGESIRTQSTLALGGTPHHKPDALLVEVATLDLGREERQETGRGQPGREGVMQGHTGSPTPSFSGGEGGWVGRGAPSSDMPFLPSLQQADLPPAMHHPLNTALRSQTAREPGACGQQRDTGGDLPGNW